MTSKLTKADLLPYEKYKDLHDKFLKEVITEKKIRRLSISEDMSGLFESKLTVFYQIQEMIRAEQITDEDYIQEMLDVYNDLLPNENELSMTLFIEIPNQQKLRQFNKTVVGIENYLQLNFGDYTINSYEPNAEEESDEEYTQSVHYLHFQFNQKEKEAFLKADEATIIVVHPNYKKEMNLSHALLIELQKQLSHL